MDACTYTTAKCRLPIYLDFKNMSDFLENLCKQVEIAAREGKALRPVGGQTKNFYGGPLQGDVVDMSPYSGIISYEPTELVMTVKAGTPLAEVEAALSAQNQELAFEPPRFGNGSTIGGAVVAGLSGPSRLARGPVKDYLLGCTIIDGKGQLLHFGGVVMKNVAGYDISRVMPGSLGTLGILIDLSIKVMPKAIAEATLQFDFTYNQAIHQINDWMAQPLPINASVYANNTLFVRLRGAKAAIESAKATMQGMEMDAALASKLWDTLRDQTHPFFQGDHDIWRLSVPATVTDLALSGEALVEWGGGLRWLKPGPGVTPEMIRGVANRAGGHATLYRTADESKRTQAFHMPQAVMANIQRKLKAQFDPAGVFSPNRLAPIL